MSAELDRILIHELVNLHGHLMDAGAFDRLNELFTEDVVYDLSALGAAELHGTAAIAEAGLALGDRNPVGHHVTNVVVVELTDTTAHAISKGIGVNSDGTTGSVVYEDSLRRTPAGWRISRRRILPRRRPLEA
ncbi:MAG: hypothetical protein JWN80_1331 [Microbacteriaceae bacterium]|nr:hypothetical protein [Microbacteriaceae bacterium]